MAFSQRHSVSLVNYTENTIGQRNTQKSLPPLLGPARALSPEQLVVPQTTTKGWNKNTLANLFPTTDLFDTAKDPPNWKPPAQVLALVQHWYDVAIDFGPLNNMFPEVATCRIRVSPRTNYLAHGATVDRNTWTIGGPGVSGMTANFDFHINEDIGNLRAAVFGAEVLTDSGVNITKITITDRGRAEMITFAKDFWLNAQRRPRHRGPPVKQLVSRGMGPGRPEVVPGLAVAPPLRLAVTQLRAKRQDLLEGMVSRFTARLRSNKAQMLHVSYNEQHTAADVHFLVLPAMVNSMIKQRIAAELMSAAAKRFLVKTNYIAVCYIGKNIGAKLRRREPRTFYRRYVAVRIIAPRINRLWDRKRLTEPQRLVELVLHMALRVRAQRFHLGFRRGTQAITTIHAAMCRVKPHEEWRMMGAKVHLVYIVSSYYARYTSLIIPSRHPDAQPPVSWRWAIFPPPASSLPAVQRVGAVELQYRLVLANTVAHIRHLQACVRGMLCKEEYQKRLDAIAQWKAFEVIRRAYHRWSNLRNTRARQLQAKVRRLLVYPEAKQRRDAERYWRVWFGNTERAHDEWSDESDDGQGDTVGGDVRAEDTWSVESDGGEVLS